MEFSLHVCVSYSSHFGKRRVGGCTRWSSGAFDYSLGWCLNHDCSYTVFPTRSTCIRVLVQLYLVQLIDIFFLWDGCICIFEREPASVGDTWPY